KSYGAKTGLVNLQGVGSRSDARENILSRVVGGDGLGFICARIRQIDLCAWNDTALRVNHRPQDHSGISRLRPTGARSEECRKHTQNRKFREEFHFPSHRNRSWRDGEKAWPQISLRLSLLESAGLDVLLRSRPGYARPVRHTRNVDGDIPKPE